MQSERSQIQKVTLEHYIVPFVNSPRIGKCIGTGVVAKAEEKEMSIMNLCVSFGIVQGSRISQWS